MTSEGKTTITFRRTLPASTFDRDALLELADILDQFGNQDWRGKKDETEIRASSYSDFVNSASPLKSLDELTIQAGDYGSPTRAELRIWRLSATLELTSSQKSQIELDRLAGKIVDVARLHRRAISAPLHRLVSGWRIFVPLCIGAGMVASVPFFVFATMLDAMVVYAIVAAGMWLAGAAIDFSPRVKIVLETDEPTHEVSRDVRSLVINIVAGFIGAAILALAAFLWSYR